MSNLLCFPQFGIEHGFIPVNCSRGFSAVTGFPLLLRYVRVIFIQVSLVMAKWPPLFEVSLYNCG